MSDVEPVINETLNNCWKCPGCVQKGYMRIETGRQSSDDSSFQHNQNNSFVDDDYNDGDDDEYPNANQTKPNSTTTTTTAYARKKMKLKLNIENLVNRKLFNLNKSTNANDDPDLINESSVSSSSVSLHETTQNNYNEDDDDDDDDDDDVPISVESLTDFDKQIILSEFLSEIYIDGVYYNQIVGPE